jgi:hypothetical protein
VYELHHFWRQEWRVGGEARERGPSYVLVEKLEWEQQAVAIIRELNIQDREEQSGERTGSGVESEL